MDPTTSSPETPEGRSGLGRGLALAGLLATLLVVGAVLSTQLADAGGWWHRGPRHHGFGDPAEMREHAEFAVGWVLRGVGADEEQREQIGAIVGAQLEQLHGLAEQHRSHRAELIELFEAPTVDRTRLEEIRSAELALADEASRGLLDALADAADLLTPEQRRELVDAVEHFRPRGGHAR